MPRWSPIRVPERCILVTEALAIAAVDAYLRRQPRAARRLVRARARAPARAARPQRRRQNHLHIDHHGVPQAAPRRDQPLRRAGRRAGSRRDRPQRHLPGAAGPAHVPHADGAREPDGGGATPQTAAADPAGRSSACSGYFRGWPSGTPRWPAHCPAASSRCWRSAGR